MIHHLSLLESLATIIQYTIIQYRIQLHRACRYYILTCTMLHELLIWQLAIQISLIISSSLGQRPSHKDDILNTSHDIRVSDRYQHKYNKDQISTSFYFSTKDIFTNRQLRVLFIGRTHCCGLCLIDKSLLRFYIYGP